MSIMNSLFLGDVSTLIMQEKNNHCQGILRDFPQRTEADKRLDIIKARVSHNILTTTHRNRKGTAIYRLLLVCCYTNIGCVKRRMNPGGGDPEGDEEKD
jgi:hypothetical protein